MNPKSLQISTVKMMSLRQLKEEEKVSLNHLLTSKIQFVNQKMKLKMKIYKCHLQSQNIQSSRAQRNLRRNRSLAKFGVCYLVGGRPRPLNHPRKNQNVYKDHNKSLMVYRRKENKKHQINKIQKWLKKLKCSKTQTLTRKHRHHKLQKSRPIGASNQSFTQKSCKR